MSKSIKFVCALSALILMGVLFSQIPQVEQNDLFSQAGTDRGYGPLVNTMIIAFALMVFAVSLVYMASKTFAMAEWEAFSKTEIYHLVIGILAGIMILAGAVVIDGITNEYVSTLDVAEMGGTTLFDVGGSYLQDTICLSTSVTLKLEGMKMAAQYLAGMKSRFYASASGWGFSFPTFPGFDVIERAIDMILMFITPFSASLLVQEVGLQIIHATALTIVMPAGILMRIFPPTRDAGSFLIASALAFYFVFPFCYLINAHVMQYLYYEEFRDYMCRAEESKLNGGWNRDFYSSLSAQLLPDINKDFLSTGTRGVNVGWGGVSPAAAKPSGFTAHLSYVIVQAVFLPAINMIMVVTFVKAGVKFFSQKFE